MNLGETETYEPGIYQLEITDPVIAGPDGIDNLQAKQLANRTNWLKAKIDSLLGLSVIHSATLKATPADADEFGFLSSSAAWSLVKMTGTNLKAWLKTYFDTVYAVLNSPAFTGTPTAPNFSYKPTPITITSWGYVTTTITLNVASHTFVAGDYIEVGGLTATTNIPNGVHLVTGVTATTIVFTYALTPTGTAGVTSATVKGYMTTNGRVEGIGVAQAWQPVTRAFGVTYTNTTGETIVASINGIGSLQGNYVSLLVDGYVAGSAGIQVSSNYAGLTATIPNGSSYVLSVSGGTFTISTWMELR